jgi:hypothetical protein
MSGGASNTSPLGTIACLDSFTLWAGDVRCVGGVGCPATPPFRVWFSLVGWTRGEVPPCVMKAAVITSEIDEG